MTRDIGGREPIMISALEHYEYCARQCALIVVDGLWGDNEHTVRGQQFHHKVDSGNSTVERGVRTIRSMKLWSVEHGLTGRADVVEVSDDTYLPVEFKTGGRHGLTADVQVCAQALCLEEMFDVRVDEGAIWFGRTRRRERVVLNQTLRAHTLAAIKSVHALHDADQLPSAVNDQRCDHCQIQSACMPERTSGIGLSASDYVASVVFEAGR